MTALIHLRLHPSRLLTWAVAVRMGIVRPFIATFIQEPG